MDTTLVILAAGLSSRFGGGSTKQVAAVGPNGEIIADYLVFDAIRGGFTKIVYVIKEDMEENFVKNVSSKIKGAEVVLAFQKMDDLPTGFDLWAREKPWGTAHALWAARHAVDEPMMLVHCDDFYGADIFATVNNFLSDPENGDFDYAVGGYRLENTLSENGGVNRGVCAVKNGFLAGMEEIREIQRRPEGIAYPAEGGLKYLPGSAIVSMGAFAFKPSIFAAIEADFAQFLSKNAKNPTVEFYLTSVVGDILQRGEATMKVLEAKARWFGVTFPEDKAAVVEAIAGLIKQGEYPQKLF